MKRGSQRPSQAQQQGAQGTAPQKQMGLAGETHLSQVVWQCLQLQWLFLLNWIRCSLVQKKSVHLNLSKTLHIWQCSENVHLIQTLKLLAAPSKARELPPLSSCASALASPGITSYSSIPLREDFLQTSLHQYQYGLQPPLPCTWKSEHASDTARKKAPQACRNSENCSYKLHVF